jgi:hypothetical protein
MASRPRILAAVALVAVVVGLVWSWFDAFVVVFAIAFVGLSIWGVRFMRGYDRAIHDENERRYADSVKRGTNWL